MPENSSMTLVTGATGDIGGSLTRLLTQAGASFRVMARRPEQVADFRARGIEAVRGDFTDPRSVRAALEGCDQLFLLPPTSAHMHEQDRRTIDAARGAGVRQVVKISGADANPQSSVPWAADHGRSDAYLRRSGLAFTLLRPTCFMANLMPMAPAIRRGVLPGISGHGATTWIAGPDIAAAAARVITDPDTQGGAGSDGRDYLLTGTQPLSFPQVATILTDELGHRVRYLHLPRPAMYLGLRASGAPHREARGLVNQFGDVVRRGLDDVRVYSADLTGLIERPATDLSAYVRAHQDDLT